jgi:hypothetical protein
VVDRFKVFCLFSVMVGAAKLSRALLFAEGVEMGFQASPRPDSREPALSEVEGRLSPHELCSRKLSALMPTDAQSGSCL